MTESEGRKGRLCGHCEKLGHIAQKCRNGKEETKKIEPQNRFEVLKSRVMQCGVREVRRQEKIEGRVRCFKCREKEHKKWECPRIKERRRGEKAVLLQEV